MDYRQSTIDYVDNNANLSVEPMSEDRLSTMVDKMHMDDGKNTPERHRSRSTVMTSSPIQNNVSNSTPGQEKLFNGGVKLENVILFL